jgi:HK97 family phage portal protein
MAAIPLLTRIKQVFRGSFGPQNHAMVAMAFGGEPSKAGQRVSIDTALQLSTVWACVRLLSETVATLPLFLYRKGPKDSRNLATDHPLYALLHDSPHADYTAVEFWEGATLCLCMHGNFYAEKMFVGNRLVALEPMSADLMCVERTRTGERQYRYRDPKGDRILDERRVFHVRGFGSGGDVGFSPISLARQSLGLSMAIEETAARMHANGIRPTGVLTVDQVLKPEQRTALRDNIAGPLAGSSNAGGLFVLEAGMKFQPIAMSAADAEMLASRAFSVEEICRWFRVPPFMVGHTQKSTSWGTGLEQQNIGFLTYSLRPYLTRIEQAIKRSLIRAEERAGLYAEFETDGLLRADSKTRTDNIVQLVTNGLLTRNEGRGILNWPALDGADELTVQAQNVPLGSTPAVPALAQPDNEG